MIEPDFEQIARQTISGSEHHISRVAAALRQVWNTRGAADIAAKDALDFISSPGVSPGITRAIKALDR